MYLRKYIPPDCKEIAELFYDTIHTINAKDYTNKQLNAWADGKINLTIWNQSFCEHFTIVAVENNRIIGFGDIDIDYIDRLYVHKNFQNKGIASAICNELEKNTSVHKITTHASITAKPFFEHQGYKVIKKQQVIKHEIALTNYVMEKILYYPIIK